MRKPLADRITEAAARLDQLRARERLRAQAAQARARKLEKRDKAKTLAGLLRSADAHRKIVLGGVVIAAGADDLDPAELCGWLLAVVKQRASQPGQADTMKENGLRRFEAQEAARVNVASRQ